MNTQQLTLQLEEAIQKKGWGFWFRWNVTQFVVAFELFHPCYMPI